MYISSRYIPFNPFWWQVFSDGGSIYKVKMHTLNLYLCLLQVTYQTDLFLDKNIDYAVNEHQILLNASTCPFVSSLFPPVEESAKSTKFTSICSIFKVQQLLYSMLLTYISVYLHLYFGMMLQQQLQSLLETLSATEPHYIRWIKPYNVLKPEIFVNSNVLQQLRCGVRLGIFLFLYSLKMTSLCDVSFARLLLVPMHETECSCFFIHKYLAQRLKS